MFGSIIYFRVNLINIKTNGLKCDILDVLKNPKNGKFCCVVIRKSFTLVDNIFLLIKARFELCSGIIDSVIAVLYNADGLKKTVMDVIY